MLRSLILLSFLGCGNLLFTSYHLQSVFEDKAQRQQISNFLNNVLRQVSAAQLLRLVDSLGTECDDQVLYGKILAKIDSIKPSFFFYHQLQALSFQKKVLAEQIKLLMGADLALHNCVEIGNPAIYLQACSDFLKITGKIYAVAESKSSTDAIQAFKFNPVKKFLFYDEFTPLNNYQAISDVDIAGNSVDLVVCTIGLHHVPVEKLHDFVSSIHRILKPGGTFILREHDCQSEMLKSLVFAAHSVYNAIATGETVAAEANEYRNFQPLAYWIDLLADQGFTVGSQRLLQAGDPTKNTLLKFTKHPASPEDMVLEVSQKLRQDDVQYERPLVKTYLSATEWYNVDVAQEYGQFINHTPFYDFPYFTGIATYWQIFGNSWQAAAKKNGHLKVLTSDHTLMNIFIGLTMTAEYAAKGALSWPVRMLFKGEEPGFIKAIVIDPKNELSTLSDKIKILQENKEFKIKSAELPRYKEFLKLLIKMADTDIVIKEIAGQKEIQFKVKTTQERPNFESIAGCKFEYSWNSVSKPNETITTLTVELDKMNQVIKALLAEGVEILYIHDF